MAGNICDVCAKEGEPGKDLMVASSAYGAISFAFCRICLSNGAEPELVFEYLRDWVDTPQQNALHESVFHQLTFKDGKYITYLEWLKDHPFDEERLQKQIDAMNISEGVETEPQWFNE